MNKPTIDDLISNTITAPVGAAPSEPLPFRTQPASPESVQLGGPSAKLASDQAADRDMRVALRTAPATSSASGATPHELVFLDESAAPAILGSRHLQLEEDDGIILDASAAAPISPRSSVLRLVSRGAPMRLESLALVWREHAQAGLAGAPVCLVEGELALAFDPRGLLEATVAYLTMLPLAEDKRVAEPLLVGRRALDAGPALPEEGLMFASTRLDDALRSVNRELHRDIESVVLRAAAARRQYATRVVFGAPHFVARVDPAGVGMQVYLPQPAGPHLPLAASLRLRSVVEVHGPQDPSDPRAISLRAIALARAV